MNRQLRRREERSKRKGGQSEIGETLKSVELLIKTGRLVKARRDCEEALAAFPDSCELHQALGVVHQTRNDLPDAIASYTAATKADPKHLPAWVNLGVCARAAKDTATAMQAFDRALEIDPNSLHAHYNRALLLCDLKQMDEAVSALKKSVELKPDFADAHYQLGFLHELAERYDDAISSYETAARHNPTSSAIELALGNCLQVIGRFEPAATHLRKAISLKPGAGRAHYMLAYSDQADASQEARDRIDRIAGGANLALEDRTYAQFAAARLHERAGDTEKAFAHYKAGNDLRGAGTRFDSSAMKALPDAIAEIFDMNFFARHCACGDETEQPVFVVGMPRSGTTLVEQIVASHPRAAGVGELANMQAIGAVPGDTGPDQPPYPANLAAVTDDFITGLAGKYLQSYPERARPFDRVIDKTPGNALLIGLLAVMFPNARFIHCRRDPLDSCWSVYCHNFITHLPYACDLAEIGLYYDGYAQIMQHWQRVLPGRILDVEYGELVATPDTGIRAIIDYCSLEWDEQCLAFHETERGVHSSSLWQVRKPVFTTSVGRWKTYETHLGPLKETLSDWV